MCGICGVFHNSAIAQDVDEKLLVAMSDTMVHRGPDDSGAYVNPSRRLGFGFRRLAIIDLSSAGHQPMSTPDGSVTIVFNGEIYNHTLLRRELESRGYRYRSRSDTETLLYCYQEYGLDFVHRLLGMFAIALWDESRQRLVLARDRIGIKPLYYAVRDGRFVFGSEIKALLRHASVVCEFNEAALEEYLMFLVPPAPTTLFRGILKLEPGHLMVVSSDGTLTKKAYWNPLPLGDQPTIDLEGNPVSRSELAAAAGRQTESEAVETIRTLLRQSIKDRMMSDVPFGVFLSGGIDSSTNVALMAELMDRPVDTFSVGFRDLEKYNELGYARLIAKRFQTNHHEIIIDQKDGFELLPRMVWHQDEPLADPVCIPLYYVSKLARDSGTIVVQVGEGSDEQFAGYASMLRDERFHASLWRAFRTMPNLLQKGTFHLANAILGRRGSLLALEYVRRAAEGDELFWGGAVNFTETHLKRLLADRGVSSGAIRRAVEGWHQDLRHRIGSDDHLSRMIALEFRNRLPELLLMRVDKMSMASSVEARVPFLDHRLVEYALRLPSKFLVKGGVAKYPLKKAVEGLIPHEIIHRRKQGFAAPVNEWIRGPWRSMAEQTLFHSPMSRLGLFRNEEVRRLFERHIRGAGNEGQLLWNLMNLHLWYERWFS